MGNQCGASTTNHNSGNFGRNTLKDRNSYQNSEIPSSQDFNKYFVSLETSNRFSSLLKDPFEKNDDFKDKNYDLGKQSTRISQLYNYGRIRAQIYFEKQQLSFNYFQQNQLQMSYLSCVSLFYCSNPFLLKKLFLTPIINPYNLFVLKMFCLGKQSEVVIDDFIPTIKESIQYTKITIGNEIWPLLLQKAWCKQIGSYDLAKGLAPEDAFEQITGIPAFSYQILRNSTLERFKKFLQKNYWIALIAGNNLQDLKSRHVFYLQQIKDQYLWIRSPYNRFNFEGHLIQDSNLVKIRFNQLERHFQFYTVGYFNPNFQTITHPHQSLKNQQKIYTITTSSDEDINIRFIQEYEGYSSLEDRANYSYSSVYLQLYDQRYNLVNGCSGCVRSNQGVRSSHVHKDVIQKLKRGKYYLKVEVDWINEKVLNEGSILIYTKTENATITNCLQSNEELIELFNRQTIKHKSEGFNVTDNIRVAYSEKANGLLIQVVNNGKTTETIRIDLSKCVNVRFKYSEFINNQTTFTLKSQENKFIQILPRNARQHMEIKDFQVTKL